jgi:hypothetical protein
MASINSVTAVIVADLGCSTFFLLRLQLNTPMNGCTTFYVDVHYKEYISRQ